MDRVFVPRQFARASKSILCDQTSSSTTMATCLSSRKRIAVDVLIAANSPTQVQESIYMENS